MEVVEDKKKLIYWRSRIAIMWRLIIIRRRDSEKSLTNLRFETWVIERIMMPERTKVTLKWKKR